MTYMKGFEKSDHETILSCLADDVTWYMPGMFHLSGKKEFDNEIQNENFVGSPVIEISRLTEENDVVVAEGNVKSQMKSGEFLNAMFCDVFEFENGIIKQLTTYQVEK
ncbi:Ketosteroid isomerase-related protein [Fodinibius sediminis]|uniref:Ketosteroid isomerase-related protein n=2 Tax=Fodinibius sediminis TaxID=1214077 RepID=A0A521EP93_9BACT|nr:Ketosteroid isomerase-related protein [Fodinibius sediminis]